MIVQFVLNGELVKVDTPPQRRASDLLRQGFSVKSLRRQCSGGTCGTCLILLDERPVLSCLIPAFELRDRDMRTVEGLSNHEAFDDIVRGFKSSGAHFCETCAPARALATEALLRRSLRPEDWQVDDAVNSVVCACTSKERIRHGILAAARLRERRIHETS